MNILELCRIVAQAEMRQFDKKDYWGYAGVSADGPHEIGEVEIEAGVSWWIVVRDGDLVGVWKILADPALPDEPTYNLTMETL